MSLNRMKSDSVEFSDPRDLKIRDMDLPGSIDRDHQDLRILVI